MYPQASIMAGLRGALDFASNALDVVLDHAHHSHDGTLWPRSWVVAVNQWLLDRNSRVRRLLAAAG